MPRRHSWAGIRCIGLMALSIASIASAACARGPGGKAGDSAAADSVAPPAASAPTPPAAADTTPQPTIPPSPDSARPAGSAQPSPTPAEDVMIGQVVAGGLADTPVTSLRVEGRGPVTLLGPLEPELRRLGGATVTVAGAPAAGTPDAAFTVSRYEIVSVDGTRPAVGTLVSRAGALWLASTDTVRLSSVPAALQGKAGAKVWIVGRRTGAELAVQSYGILREP